VASILTHGQHAAAVLVEFVDLALAGQRLSVAVGNNLGRQIEAVDVMLVRGEHDVDHDHIRFGIVIGDRPFQIESPALIGGTGRIACFKRIVEQALEIARNPLVHERGRSYHHGDTIDQLPAFLVRPALIEGTERLDRKAQPVSLRSLGHLSAPAPNAPLLCHDSRRRSVPETADRKMRSATTGQKFQTANSA
jgi:hypothetical protein